MIKKFIMEWHIMQAGFKDEFFALSTVDAIKENSQYVTKPQPVKLNWFGKCK